MQLSLALTKDEIVQALQAAQAAQLKAAQAARAQGTTTPSQAAPRVVRQPKPSNPGQITIYGLDGGPRVIQTTH